MSRLYRINDPSSLAASIAQNTDGPIRRYLPKERTEFMNLAPCTRDVPPELKSRSGQQGGAVKHMRMCKGRRIRGQKGSGIFSNIGKFFSKTAKKVAKGVKSGAKAVSKAVKKEISDIRKHPLSELSSLASAPASAFLGPEAGIALKLGSKVLRQSGRGESHGLSLHGTRFQDNFPARPRGMDLTQGGDPLNFQGSMQATLENIEKKKALAQLRPAIPLV